MEGVSPFAGKYKCTLRERFMGVNKVKMRLRFEQLVGWADSKDAALSTALYN